MSISNKRTKFNNNYILNYEIYNEEKTCMDVCERQYQNMKNILDKIIQIDIEDIEYIFRVREISIKGIKQITADKYNKETKKLIERDIILEWNIIKEYLVIGKFIENKRTENNIEDSGHESELEYESEYDEGEYEISDNEKEEDYSCHYKEAKKESIGHKINSICINYHLTNREDYIVKVALLDTPNGGYEKIFQTIEERFRKNVLISLINDDKELCKEMERKFRFYKYKYNLKVKNNKLHKYLEKYKKKFDLIWFDATRTPSDEELNIVKKSMKKEGYLILTIPTRSCHKGRTIEDVKKQVYETNMRLSLFDTAVRADCYYNKKEKKCLSYKCNKIIKKNKKRKKMNL